ITDGVLILDTVQAAEDDPAPDVVRPFRPPANPVGQSQNLFLRWAGFRLRGHLARLDSLQHREPPLPGGRVGELRGEQVQVKISLWLLSSVTAQAVPDEKRTDLVGITPGVRPPLARGPAG